MKHKCLIFILLLLGVINTGSVMGQTVQMDSVMSNDPKDWFDKKEALKVIFTGTPVARPVRVMLTWKLNSGVVAMTTDSTVEKDTIKMGLDTFFLDDIFNPFYGDFEDTLGKTLQKRGTFVPGNYSFEIRFYDTTFSSLYYVVTKSFKISPHNPPAILSPSYGKKICTSKLGNYLFKWLPVTPAPGYNVDYKFKLVECASGQSEYTALATNPIIYQQSVVNFTQLTLPNSIIPLLDMNKLYVWTVQAVRLETQVPIVTQNGMAVPFRVQFSNNASFCSGVPNMMLDESGNNQCQTLNGFENNDWNGQWEFQTMRHYVGTSLGGSMGKFLPKFLRKAVFNFFNPVYQDEHAFNNVYDLNNYSFALLNRHQIVNKTVDPYCGIPTVPDGGGMYAAKIGNNLGGSDAEAITFTFTVTNDNKIFRYWDAYVLASTVPPESPTYKRSLYMAKCWTGGRNRQNNNPFAKYGGFLRSADFRLKQPLNDRYNTRQKLNASGIYYEDWQCNQFDLSDQVGRTVTVEFSTADCMNGDHFAYAYIDFCVTNNIEAGLSMDSEFCEVEDVIANGSTSKNEDQYIVKVFNSNSSGAVLDELVTSTIFLGEAPADINVTGIMAGNDKKFTCGNYYIVRLIVENCGGSDTEDKLIRVLCPEKGLAGPDKCAFGTTSIQLGTTAKPGMTYEWLPADYLSSTTISNPIFNSVAAGTFDVKIYYLITTDVNGCQSLDEVDIYGAAPVFSITKDSFSCGFSLHLAGTYLKNSTIQWKDSRGDVLANNVVDLHVPTTPANYHIDVKITNPCGSSTKRVYLSQYTGPGVPNLAYPSTYDTNDYFWIAYDYKYVDPVTGAISTGPDCYNSATDWKLELLARNGEWQQVAGSTYSHALTNGEVKWDWKLFGTFLQDGVYHIRLSFKYCNGGQWSTAHNWGYRDLICDKRKFNLGCLCNLCRKAHWGPLQFLERRASTTAPHTDWIEIHINR